MASRSPRDRPLSGAGKPVLLAVALAALLVVTSLLLQHTGVVPDGSDTPAAHDQAHPPARSSPMAGLLSLPTTPVPPAPSPEQEPAEVVRVVDGDTARVRIGGTEATLRFIGLDTPETVHPSKPVECYGPEASEEARRLLPVGSQVWVMYDHTQGRTDRYGRTLVYLEVRDGMDYAHHMIGMGFGTEYRYRTDYQRMTAYRAAQERAKAEERGLWGACPR